MFGWASPNQTPPGSFHGDEGQGEKPNFLGILNRIENEMKRKCGEGDWGRYGEVFKIAAKLIWGAQKVGENKKEMGQ